MIDYYSNFITKYSNKGIVIDSNLLLLYYIGCIDKEFISKYKRTTKYACEDYDTLRFLLSKFNKKYTTPNILTEVSNLANSLTDDYRVKFFRIFGEDIKSLQEEYMNSKVLSLSKEFVKYGLTDMAIITLMRRKLLLLTDDFRLAQYVSSLKVDVLNFNHIRVINWKQ